MSTSPYSEDLRLRVIKHLKKGNSYKESARLFELSESTIGKVVSALQTRGALLSQEKAWGTAKNQPRVIRELCKIKS